MNRWTLFWYKYEAIYIIYLFTYPFAVHNNRVELKRYGIKFTHDTYRYTKSNLKTLIPLFYFKHYKLNINLILVLKIKLKCYVLPYL